MRPRLAQTAVDSPRGLPVARLCSRPCESMHGTESEQALHLLAQFSTHKETRVRRTSSVRCAMLLKLTAVGVLRLAVGRSLGSHEQNDLRRIHPWPTNTTCVSPHAGFFSQSGRDHPGLSVTQSRDCFCLVPIHTPNWFQANGAQAQRRPGVGRETQV